MCIHFTRCPFSCHFTPLQRHCRKLRFPLSFLPCGVSLPGPPWAGQEYWEDRACGPTSFPMLSSGHMCLQDPHSVDLRRQLLHPRSDLPVVEEASS
jgi:hypothetical protein